MQLPADSAARVTRRRAERRLSFRQAAAASDLAVGTWQRAEAGDGISYQSLVAIVAALDWPPEMVDELLAGTGPSEDAARAFHGAPDGATAADLMARMTPAQLAEWLAAGQTIVGSPPRSNRPSPEPGRDEADTGA